MAELSGDAQELLGKTPEPAAGAAQPTGDQTQGKPEIPAGYVPIAALRGEQEAARKAREETQVWRERGMLYGGLDAEGNPPPPKPQPGSDKAPQEFVDAYNSGDPEAMYRVWNAHSRRTAQEEFANSAPGYMDPFARAGFETYKERLSSDPDFTIWKGTFEQELERQVNMLPPHLRPVARVSKDVLDGAAAVAQMRHKQELITKAVERAQNPGKVVGRWTEGAAPSQGEAPTPALSPEYHEWGKAQGVSDEILAAAAKLKAEREGRTR